MSEIDELKTKRQIYWKDLKSSSAIWHRAKNLLAIVERRYYRDKELYESTDRKLAFLDGRRQVVEPQMKGKKKPPEPAELTTEQLKEIARRLGIKIEDTHIDTLPNEEPPYELGDEDDRPDDQ